MSDTSSRSYNIGPAASSLLGQEGLGLPVPEEPGAGAGRHHRHPQVEVPCQLPSLHLLGLEVLEGSDGSDGLTSIVESQRTMKRTPKMKLTIIPKKVTPLAELSILEVLLAPRIPPLLILLNKFQTIKNNSYDLVLRTL